jgi:hypothetical protein
MMTAIRIIPVPVKKLNKADYIIPLYRKIESEKPVSKPLAEPEDLSPKRIAEIQKEHHREQFKDWCMPEQPDGYIKAAKFDPL